VVTSSVHLALTDYFPKQRLTFLHFAGVGHPLHGLNAAFAFDVAARAPRTGFLAITISPYLPNTPQTFCP